MGALAGFRYLDIVRRLKLKQAGIDAESFLQKK